MRSTKIGYDRNFSSLLQRPDRNYQTGEIKAGSGNEGKNVLEIPKTTHQTTFPDLCVCFKKPKQDQLFFGEGLLDGSERIIGI